MNNWKNRAACEAAARLLPFFREYPYRGPVSFFKVDPRGAYSPAEPFFYNRVPNAANSTITATLRSYSTYRRAFSRDDNPKDHFLRPSYLGSRNFRRLRDEAFKFTVVRDPYSRTLSAFQSKILRHRPQEKAFRAWFKSDATPSFLDFCHYLDDGHLWADAHWAPQSDIMLLPVETFDFIGRFENLNADLGHIVRTIFGDQIDFRIETSNISKPTNAQEKVPEFYGPAETKIVTRLFERDFQTFGYARR